MTLNVHRRRDKARCRRARVTLNGLDVTALCFYVDGRRGVVRLYLQDAKGQKFLEPPDWRARGLEPHVATEERRGRVRLTVR